MSSILALVFLPSLFVPTLAYQRSADPAENFYRFANDGWTGLRSAAIAAGTGCPASWMT